MGDLSTGPTAKIGAPDWFKIAQSVTYRGAILIAFDGQK